MGAARNPRATFKTPIIIEDVLNSRMIAYPFRLLQCCLVTEWRQLPLNTNGGGLSYMHFGMYALQESVPSPHSPDDTGFCGATVLIIA
jgi:hypothetical protein